MPKHDKYQGSTFHTSHVNLKNDPTAMGSKMFNFLQTGALCLPDFEV